MRKSAFKSLPFIYLLFAYVLTQFSWWIFSMARMQQQVYEGEKLNSRILMIAGEGLVFFVILLLGAIYTVKLIKREILNQQAQQNFLLATTHELKSPIASIKLYIQTLQKRNLPEEKKEGIIDNCLKDISRLNHLVDNILLTTQIDNQAFDLHKEKNDLSVFIQEVLVPRSETIGRKMQTRFDIESGLSLTFDKQAMASILINLYENAVKYADDGTEILISLKKQSEGLALSVADQGPGIPPEQQKLVFQKFYRPGNEMTRNQKGTGLGLFLVKYFVESHNGHIRIKTNQPKGSIFAIQFRTH